MSSQGSDQIAYDGGFEFNEEVADVFDNMLSRSIPDYRGMRDMVALVGGFFADSPWHTVADVGSSLGESFRPFAEAGCRVLSIEPSEPMLSRQRERFTEFDNIEYAKVCAADGLGALEDDSLDLCIFCLTLQFMAMRERDEALALAHKKLRAGGAVVIVQKDNTGCKTFDDIAGRKYYEIKKRNGYNREQIETKKRALNGRMEIDTYRQSVGRLILAGFGDAYEFWRSLNFSAVLAIK